MFCSIDTGAVRATRGAGRTVGRARYEPRGRVCVHPRAARPRRAARVREHRFRSGKGHEPFAGTQRRKPSGKGSRIGKLRVLAEELQLATVVNRFECLEEAAPEEAREYAHGQEEARPACQSLARAQWLDDRQADLLPVPYFHVVFTVPEEIAAIAYQNKVVVYDILFQATAKTLLTIAADPKHLGADIGFVAILHTWGQNLMHHPHLHCVVPGGGLAPDHSRWIACRPGFFLPVRVLSRLFRRLFLERLQCGFDTGRLQFFNALAPVRVAQQPAPRNRTRRMAAPLEVIPPPGTATVS
jgi:hypothetical protein